MEEPRRLGNRYELGAVLGRGGMAAVYLARDLSHLAERVGQFSSATMTRLVGLGGRFARIIGSRS